MKPSWLPKAVGVLATVTPHRIPSGTTDCVSPDLARTSIRACTVGHAGLLGHGLNLGLLNDGLDDPLLLSREVR